MAIGDFVFGTAMRMGRSAAAASRYSKELEWARSVCRAGELSAVVEQAAEDGVEHAAVAVVLGFDGGVDSAHRRELNLFAIGLRSGDIHIAAGLDEAFGGRGEVDVEGFFAGEAEGGRGLAILEAEGQHAHADEVGAVDAFEGFGDDGAAAEEKRALGGPVAA